jgi:PBSX family phage terminase large subunit
MTKMNREDIPVTVVFEQNWDAVHALDDEGKRRYRYIINEGSSRSSKTISLIDCFDLYAYDNDNKRLTVWRDTKTDCKKTVLTDALKHLKNTGRYKVDQDFNKTESIFTYTNGSTFEIHGTDDEETLHGLTQQAAWLNEPYKISRDTFDQIDQRTSDFILIDWNPKKAHWIDDLKKDPRTILIKSTFRDNPFCPIESKIKILSYQPVNRCYLVESKSLTEQEARAYDLTTNPNGFDKKHIKELTRCRENEAKNTANDFNWSVYGLGEKAERPNRIFHWNEISIEDYLRLDAPVYNATDWGTVDPWGILEAKYYDGALYFHEKNYASENEIRAKLSPADLAQINAEDEGIVRWLFRKCNIDQKTTIVCDTNRPNKIAALRRAGWAYAVPANKGTIVDRIDGLNDMRCYYTSTSENLKYEQENYSWKVDRYGVVLEEPEDMYNHLLDASSYIYLHLKGRGIIKKV